MEVLLAVFSDVYSGKVNMPSEYQKPSLNGCLALRWFHCEGNFDLHDFIEVSATY